MIEWTPENLGEGTTWTKKRALHVATRLRPGTTATTFTRAASLKKRGRVLEKGLIVCVFNEHQVPLDFDDFMAARADFDLASTDCT
jgi:hypothetical protein